MAKTEKIPDRSSVKTKDAWDLAQLYKSDAAWERAFKKVASQIGEFQRFRGTLGESPTALKACLEFDTEFDRAGEKLGSYAFLKASQDVSNSAYQGMVARFTHFATEAGEAASFIAPEIQSIPKKKLERFVRSATLKDYRFNLEKLMRYKRHILSAKEERVLAMQGEITGTASRVFSQLTDADFSFGFVKDERGTKVELTQSSLGVLTRSQKRSVRREAFTKFYKVYDNHKNTLGASLNGSVLQDIYHARVRNHPSARESALFSDKVPVSVYDSLIEAVHDNLDTVYRYIELRRKALRVKELRAYDNNVPLVDPGRVKIPYAEAVDMVCEAVRPLGAEYGRTLRKGLNGRWVDRYENRGKRSGAFSAGGYEGPPYILMNYKEGTLDSAFTLAHEAGHSMHTYYSARNQTYQNYQYTIFVAEVASTFNEELLNHYLLERATTKKRRAYLINREIDQIRGTIIRQTMFAEYEKIIHAIAEAGEPLTVERLRAEYLELIKLYFGPKFVIDDVLSLEGMRIPHFYHAFYVYKYATGLSAAISLAKGVLNGGKKELNAYLRFLKSGGSKFPLDLLRGAGVDLEKPEPVQDAMDHLRNLVDELETLL
ncbi:MAG: oligoendopeptidase F [Candidatus Hydrogenedentes bacterium]|nr:oligoendopeptidase F [Candidatus Hydrogenedentota bacterium]